MTLTHCERFILESQPSTLTARKHYGHLRAAFDQAVAKGYIEENPFKRLAKPRAAPYEVESLTAEELEVVLSKAASDTFSQRRFVRMISVTFRTGLRLAEVRQLETGAVDFDRRLLYVFNSRSFRTKTGKRRAIPLDQTAIALLRDQIADNAKLGVECLLLFPSRRGSALSESSASNQFRELCRKTFPARNRLCFHSLRHSFATNNALLGIPLQEIQRAMGHSSIAVTERYAHLQRAEFPGFRSLGT